MKNVSPKEKDAIIRMMVYLKFELIRIGLDSEADLIKKAIALTEESLKDVDQ